MLKIITVTVDMILCCALALFLLAKYFELTDLSWWWIAGLILNPIKVFVDLGKKAKQFWIKRIQGRYG